MTPPPDPPEAAARPQAQAATAQPRAEAARWTLKAATAAMSPVRARAAAAATARAELAATAQLAAGGDSAGGADGEGGEGGQAPVACRVDLFKFDTDPGTGSMKTYLTPATGPVQSSTVSWSPDVGAPTPGSGPGSGKLIATFGALGEQAQLSVYPPAGPLACHTKLHAKVKLISAGDLSTLNGISLSINSGPFDSTGRYSSQLTSTSSWALDTWYTIELPFATAGYQSPPNTLPLFEDVRGFGVQLQTKSTGATPVEVTMYVDDIWVD